MTRVLVLCTHNAARSQMAEGWIRHHARERSLALEVHSAGTERTRVRQEAVAVMAEVGVDIRSHVSKGLEEIDDPATFDIVVTVCDAANEACPLLLATARRLHVPFPDPSGEPLERWREVRDAIAASSLALVTLLGRGVVPVERDLALGSPPA